MTKGSMFQSEDMTLVQVIFPREAAYYSIAELGETGKIYFRDLNIQMNSYSRRFVEDVRRCDEIEKELRFLAKELERAGMKMKSKDEIPPAPPGNELTGIEYTVKETSDKMREVATSMEELHHNMTDLIELRHIMEKTKAFFEEKDIDLVIHLDTEAIVPVGGDSHAELGHVTGIINTEKVPGFEQMLWRACRGNLHIKHEDIDLDLEDPATGDKVYKSAFIVFFQGEYLRSRVKKICDAYHAHLYTIPDLAEERRETIQGVQTRIEDIKKVLQQTNDHRQLLLTEVAANLREWMIKVRKVKAIYHTMNLLDFDVTQSLLVGEGWVPVHDLHLIEEALKRGQVMSGSEVDPIMNEMEHKLNPPTYFRTNKFTKIFQDIVSSYGVPRYKEVNPALYTIITFPFLFSVMFGDAGDAILMVIFALMMIAFESKLGKNPSGGVFDMFFGGRYVILLMGLFSIYSGVMYNDMFSISFNIFGTAWHPNTTTYNISTDLGQINSFELNPNMGWDYTGYPYPFGMDPVWMLATNSITWLNSFKMKMSVIMGVTQMFFGISLSLVNHIHFRDWLGIFCEFIPEVIFIACIFGYMNMLIFYKWIVYNASDAACAPTILVDMIDMFLLQYPDSPCYSQTFYPTLGSPIQKYVQSALIIAAVICVPWLLLPKPLILRARHIKAMKAKAAESPAVTVTQTAADVEAAVTSGAFRTLDNDVAETSFGVTNAGFENDEEKKVNKEKEAKENTYENIEDVKDKAGEEKPVKKEFVAITVDEERERAAMAAANESSNRIIRPDEFEEEEFDFGELFVHQAIHTIEYCLGCISHTASYLRLWALSLAHAELAEVLWVMVIHFAFITPGYYGIITQFFFFPAWAVLTIAILLLMEGLSAFLHTLRLHWVEFQSKFYKGTGHKFLPFSFKTILKEMWIELKEAS